MTFGQFRKIAANLECVQRVQQRGAVCCYGWSLGSKAEHLLRGRRLCGWTGCVLRGWSMTDSSSVHRDLRTVKAECMLRALELGQQSVARAARVESVQPDSACFARMVFD